MVETTSMTNVIRVVSAGAGGNRFMATTMPKVSTSNPVTTRLMPWRTAIQIIGIKLR